MSTHFRAAVALLAIVSCLGCPASYRQDLDYEYNIEQTFSIDEISSTALVQFESVSWDPDQDAALRKLICADQIASGRDVLQLGTGIGALAVLCLRNSAKQVVATDSNPAAVANTKYNAASLQLDTDLDARLVTAEQAGTFAAVKSGERFDLIIRHLVPATNDQLDQNQMRGFLDPLVDHLKPGGRSIVYCATGVAVDRWRNEATGQGYQVELLGDRNVDASAARLYPAALLEIRIPMERYNQSSSE
jgi:cyclopropane fatty-acyl-phospholipid synthase-like methyltransferase